MTRAGEYVPSDPPTIEDWRHLEQRAEANRKRGRRGVLLSAVALTIAVGLIVAGALVYSSQRDVPKVLRNQTAVLAKINEVVAGLQTADRDRTKASKGTALSLAQIVEGIARGFATPPTPDPNRLTAVNGLCRTAAQFRAAAGAPPEHCP